MTPILLKGIIFISLALVLYTTGVFAEKISGKLKLWHVIVFYFGLLCDTLGTHYMSQIAGGFSVNLHSITGAMALILMLIHALWASVVVYKQDEASIQKFHKLSIVVWLIWLVPYFLGMFIGMGIA